MDDDTENIHRTVIRNNLTKLSKGSKLTEELLDLCREKKIITETDRAVTVRLKVEGSYKMNSYFYNELLYRADAKKYKLFYKLAKEEDYLQPENILNILKQGVLDQSDDDMETDGNWSSDKLMAYKFDKTSFSDGTSFRDIQLQWAHQTSSSNADAPRLVFPTYEMPPRGGRYALMINITKFSWMDDRSGAQFDSQEMAKVLRQLDFKVYEVEPTISRHQLLTQRIVQFKKECEKDAYACVVVIMSHGDRDIIYTSNEEPVIINSDILAQFNNANFKFAGKPKMFFIQACRGSVEDRGVPTKTDTPTAISRWENISTLKIPSWTDMLVAYSTWEGQASYRESNGSWFIQILAKKLSEYGGKQVDICKILVLVAEQMKGVEGSSGQKQICPWTNIGFTKEFYF